MDVTNEKNRPNAPKKRDGWRNPPLEVTPVVGIVPEFHVERLFKQQAGKKLENGGYQTVHEEKGDEVIIKVVSAENDRDNSKAINGTVGGRLKIPGTGELVASGNSRSSPRASR